MLDVGCAELQAVCTLWRSGGYIGTERVGAHVLLLQNGSSCRSPQAGASILVFFNQMHIIKVILITRETIQAQ